MTADEWVDPVPFARAAPTLVDADLQVAPVHAPEGSAARLQSAAAEIHDGGRFCERCEGWRELVDEFDGQVGFEERAREYRVTALDCGHEIVRPS